MIFWWDCTKLHSSKTRLKSRANIYYANNSRRTQPSFLPWLTQMKLEFLLSEVFRFHRAAILPNSLLLGPMLWIKNTVRLLVTVFLFMPLSGLHVILLEYSLYQTKLVISHTQRDILRPISIVWNFIVTRESTAPYTSSNTRSDEKSMMLFLLRKGIMLFFEWR